ncbi:MAG: heparinase II/III family protein [Opitutales bacterium]|nr:heparinase II/III family protein [Opitutales bacterium]
MNRRNFFKLGGSSLAMAGLPQAVQAAGSSQSPRKLNLYYHPDDLPRIRANAKTPLLAAKFEEWKQEDPARPTQMFKTALETLDLIREYYQGLYALSHSALVQLVEPSESRAKHILEALEALVALPNWDYFREDRTKVIGFQRAPWGVKVALFARQVIQDRIDADFDRKLMDAVAEKGCLPCYRTVFGMDNVDKVKGWGFDEVHEGFYDIDMSRWPMIVGANNLRSDPSAALGIGALALLGYDDRAEKWLKTAEDSMRRVMTFFEDDGSFFEAISYAAYTWRTGFSFFEAHERVRGTIDWGDEIELDKFLDFMLVSQAGRQPEGAPDVMNFGDTFGSVNPCVPSWIGTKTGNPLAQFVAEKVSEPRFIFDFLWYYPERSVKQPSDALLNVRTDLDWIFCRTGWGENDAALGFRSGGPANHEHADRNSFIYKIYGERLLNDPFRADYDWRQPRWLLRLTEAHNTVLVGDRGQQYHRGEEGTNDGLSYSNVMRFEDLGHVAWWTSDATAAYRIDNYHIFKVLRTVIFAKPDIVVVLDQVQLRYWPQTLDVRFHPDNRDGAAEVASDGEGRFSIKRPKARLDGQVFSRSGVDIRTAKLDIPDDAETFPYVELRSDKALRHEVLTVLTASDQPDRSGQPQHSVEQSADGWRIKAGRLQALLITRGQIPVVKLV